MTDQIELENLGVPEQYGFTRSTGEGVIFSPL